MNQSYSEIITESVVDIFEKAAFLFPIPIEETEEGCSDEDGQMICIGITFNGPSNGEFIISLPKELTKEISANMLGIDEDDPDVEQKSIDAAKEILNIVCGNILPKIYGEEPIFYLSAPYILERLEDGINETKNYDITKIQMDVDDNIVTFIFAVEQ